MKLQLLPARPSRFRKREALCWPRRVRPRQTVLSRRLPSCSFLLALDVHENDLPLSYWQARAFPSFFFLSRLFLPYFSAVFLLFPTTADGDEPVLFARLSAQFIATLLILQLNHPLISFVAAVL